MRNRWMVGSLAVAVLGLAGMRAAGLVSRGAKASDAVLAMPDEPKVERVRWKSPIVLQANPGDHPPTTAPESVEVPMPAPGPAPDDPMGAVDSFLRRSRQEADESIKALAREAEALKARLQKVEAALGRWQAVAGALDQDGKRQWREPEAEIAPQLETIPSPKAIAIPAPGVEPPPALPAEPPSADSIPLPTPVIPEPE